MAQFTLDGTEKKIEVLGLYAAIKNNSDSTIYAGAASGVDPSGEETTPIQPGESVVIPVNKDKAVYLLGTGKAAVLSSNERFNFFKPAPTAGGGSGDGITQQQLDDTLKLYATNASVDSKLERYATSESVNEGLSGKVNIVEGMGLSENSFTNADKEKLGELSNYNDTGLKKDIADLQAGKLDINELSKGIRGYTFLSDLKAGKYLKVLSVQLGDYRYYKYFTALLALNSFFASTSGLDKTKLDMIVSLDARQSSTNLDNIEFYAYSNAVPAMFNTERFIVAYKRVNTTDALFEVYIRLVYDYEYFSANVINSYTLPASPIDFPMALVDEIPSDMTTSTLYVNKTYINAPSATAEKAGIMSAEDKTKLDSSVSNVSLNGKSLTITKNDGTVQTITLP